MLRLVLQQLAPLTAAEPPAAPAAASAVPRMVACLTQVLAGARHDLQSEALVQGFLAMAADLAAPVEPGGDAPCACSRDLC